MTTDDKLDRLLNSALFVDSATGHGFRNVADLIPKERERSERFWRWARQHRPETVTKLSRQAFRVR